MTLDMSGHIDDVFETGEVTLIYGTGGYVGGIWQGGAPQTEKYTATIQPLSDKELGNLLMGGQRILDSRKLYINDGNLALLKLGKDMQLLSEDWKIVYRDVRENRNYAKIVVVRYDDQ